jgi:hypothetical protein
MTCVMLCCSAHLTRSIALIPILRHALAKSVIRPPTGKCTPHTELAAPQYSSGIGWRLG